MIAVLRRGHGGAVRARLGLVPAASSTGRLVARIGRWLRPVAHRIGPAAVRDLDDETLGRRLLLGGVGAMLGARLLPGTPFGRAALGAVGMVLLSARLERRDRERSAEAILAMPDLLDRIAMCVLAGRSVEHALRIVSRDAVGDAGNGPRLAVATLDAGGSRRDAFDALLRGPSGDAWQAPVAALERAERLGVPVADVLVAQAREMRHQARTIVEAQVRAAPIKLVFPLVFCFMPAFIVLAVGPVALSALKTLSSL